MTRVRHRGRRPVGLGILAAAIVAVLLFPPVGATPVRGVSLHPVAAAGLARSSAHPSDPAVSPGMPDLDAGGWINRTASLAAAPSARFGAMMAYDVADGELVLFGGTGDGHQVLRDTWAYVDGVWHNITNLAGTAPTARTDGMMAYDAADGELVLYGGIHLGTYQSDTWAFKGGQWSSVTTNTSAGPLADASMSFDPIAQQLVLFGGSPHPGTVVRNTTFGYAHGVWKNLTSTAGTPPPGVTRASMTWDAHLNETILFGGVGPRLSYNQTWAFSLGRWRQLSNSTQPAPPARSSAGFAYDAVDGYDVLFGGTSPGVSYNDTWAYRGGNWSRLPEGSAPSDRNLESFAYTPGPTPSDASIVLFGGRSTTLATAANFSDTWTYKLPLQAAVQLSVSTLDVTHLLTVGIAVAGGYPPYTVNWTSLPAGCAGPTTPQSFPCTPQFVGALPAAASVNDSAGVQVNATPLNLTIEPLPTLSMTAYNTNGPATLTSRFVVSLIGGTTPFTWTWNFGNGFANSSGPAPQSRNHTYSKQGEYTSMLSVTDADGVTVTSLPILINVTAQLTAVATSSTLYGWAPLLVTFSSQVTGGIAPYAYSWNLGQGGPLYTQTSPRTTYNAPGVYHVVLNVTDDLDNLSSSSLNISVVAPLTTTFSSSFPGGPTCTGSLAASLLQLGALPNGGSGPYNDTWSVNGSTYYGTTPPAASFTGGTVVPVNLTVTDARGNRTSAAHAILIPTTSCGTVSPPSAGVSTGTLELYAGLAIAILVVIAVEAGILLRGRKRRDGTA